MSGYSEEQIYAAMRAADAAGDGEAVKALAAQLGGISGSVSDETPSPYDPPKPPPTTMEQLGQSTQNAVAGLAQGAAFIPDALQSVATGVNRGINYGVTQGGGALMDMLGFDGAADKWRASGDKIDDSFAKQQTLGDMIETVSPTPDGMGASRFAAQFVGGMAVPFGPKAAPRTSLAPAAPKTAQQEIVKLGDQFNVPVMTSDVAPPRNFVTKTTQALGERIPFAGTGGPRQTQNVQRIEAVKELAKDFGVDGTGELLDEVTANLSATRGAKIANLAGQKNSVIDGIQGPVDMARTAAVIDREIASLSRSNAEAFDPVIKKLQSFRNVLTSGKSLREIETNRKLLGDIFEDQNLAAIKGEGQKALNRIYEPLREDMGVFISRNAPKEAYTKWVKANDELAAMAGELKDGVFKGVLRDSETTPENVAKLLFSKKPSEVKRLVANLDGDGIAKAQGAVIHRAMEKAGMDAAGGMDNISPQLFANEIARLGKSVGVVFKGADLQRVEGLRKLVQATQRASVAAAAPPTGVQNSLPILTAVLADMMGGAGAGLTTAGVIGLAARAYESKATRNLLIGLSKSKPGSPAEGKFIERIAKGIASQAEIQSSRVGSAANSNVGIPVAAGDTQENQPQQ